MFLLLLLVVIDSTVLELDLYAIALTLKVQQSRTLENVCAIVQRNRSMPQHVHVVGVNGSRAIRRLLMCENAFKTVNGP